MAASSDAGLSGHSDSSLDASSLEQAVGHRMLPARWIGWRMRILLFAALLGCLALFGAASQLAEAPHLDASWRADDAGHLLLVQADDEILKGLQGRHVVGLGAEGASPVTVDALILQRSPRWLIDDRLRDRHVQLHDALSQQLSAPRVELHFADGSRVAVSPSPRGMAGLGVLFWLIGALAFVLYLIAMVVVLARPSGRNVVYALMAWCQAGTLFIIAVESLPGLGLPDGFMRLNPPLRMVLDLCTAAALVQANAMHPRRLPGHAAIGAAAWITALSLSLGVVLDKLPSTWWTVQIAILAYAMAALALLTWSYRIERNPFAVVLRRFGFAGLATLVLLTIAVAVADHRSAMGFNIPAVGSSIWHVFLASLLLLVPFLSRSRQMLREFVMLAGVSTVATSLDLLFVAVFSWGQFASLTLALFLSLGAYAAARQWILNQMLGSRLQTTERMFEQLYRIARDIEARPESAEAAMTRLLRDLFEPLEVLHVPHRPSHSRVLRDGSALLVPAPALVEPSFRTEGGVLLRFAQRGRRLFTQDDARLADGIADQLQRAVAYDQAVERGRSEERARLAQDLHDDIGARLLTLMYQAPTPEMEAYLRHTLQDLKTLTRGLAAASHPLAHAAAEWKADLAQRLTAVQCELQWTFESDREVVLNVVQWSGLTRILRELVSNAIAHARATRVSVHLRLADGSLTLKVCDDGMGADPSQWSHGLGLGGIRKRAKQLGGQVRWFEQQPRGICCVVDIPQLELDDRG